MASQNFYSDPNPHNYQSMPQPNNSNNSNPFYPMNQYSGNYNHYQQPMFPQQPLVPHGPMMYQQQMIYQQPLINQQPVMPSQDFILFYDDDKPFYEFTNFANYGFKLDDYYWQTSEHYFQAQKFSDYPSKMHQVRKMFSPREAFEYVRRPENKSLVRKDWPTCKDRIMSTALKAKFSQNEKLQKMLLDTGSKVLIEDSPYDPYWGVGKDKQGLNRLGELLMQLRTELSTQQPPAIQTPTPSSPPPQQRHRRSSSMSRLATPSPFEFEDFTAITYDADDSTHYLSNCYPTSFYLERNTWPSVMHYFIAKKFDLKPRNVRKILALPVRDVHKYSRDPRNINDISKFWDSDKQKIMFSALKAKFEKNPLKQKLLDTGTKEIVERSSFDSYWSQNADGSGENQMGKLLAQLRFELRSLSRYTPTPTLTPTPDLSVRNITTKMDETSLSTPPRQKSPDSIYFSDSGIQSEYSEFSSFSTHGFYLDSQNWPSLQHYIQAQKYIDNDWIVKEILKTMSPREAYNKGESLKHYVRKSDWEKRREIVMKKALKTKFSDPQLKQKLLDTGNKKLFFDTKEDEFWGVRKKQKGKNKLGVLLMELRDELRTASSKPSYSTPFTTTHSTPPYKSSISTPSITHSQITPSVDRSLKPSAYSSSISHSKDREIIYFYDRAKPYFEFTPYSEHGFQLEGVYWKTLNHYFQAQKFVGSHYHKLIIEAKTPEEATNISLKYLATKRLSDDEKEFLMKKGLSEKFSQNPHLPDLLIKTGSKRLMFKNPNDFIWGTGSLDIGDNKLGILLMSLREKLQNSSWPNKTKYSSPLKAPQSDMIFSDDDTNNPPLITPSVDRSLKPPAYSSSISHSGDREIIHFYDSRDPYFEFTPYSYHGFYLDGVYWKTLNHYFQAQKFHISFHRDKIQRAKTPEEATKLAKTTFNTKILIKDDKEKIMRKGLEAKFSKHQNLAALLMKTGSSTLKFIHPDDIFWGTGSFTVVGKNRLGILLMDLREKLQNSSWPNKTKYSNPFKASQSNDDTSNQKNAYAKPTQKWTMYLPPKVFFSPKSIFLIFLCLIWFFVLSTL